MSTSVVATSWRHWLLGAIALAGILAAFALEPIPQDPAYHDFADTRTILGVPNFWNVASNLPFVLVGLLGLARLSKLRDSTFQRQFVVYCLGTLLVGFGSGWYHWAPSNATLVWDRLPMTIAFMALFALVLGDRVSKRLGRLALLPLLAAGAISISYWWATESAGRGDLRPYGLVQFLPMLLIPAMLLLFPGRGLESGRLWQSLAAYLAAKLFEAFDAQILAAGEVLSGHGLKHLAAAVSAWLVVLAATQASAGATGDGGARPGLVSSSDASSASSAFRSRATST